MVSSAAHGNKRGYRLGHRTSPLNKGKKRPREESSPKNKISPASTMPTRSPNPDFASTRRMGKLNELEKRTTPHARY